MSAWIKMISDEEADDTLKQALDFARTPHGTVDNVMRVHSLRPSTMNGHVVLYRACLHDCLLYTSPSPRDRTRSRMPSSA